MGLRFGWQREGSLPPVHNNCQQFIHRVNQYYIQQRLCQTVQGRAMWNRIHSDPLYFIANQFLGRTLHWWGGDI